MRWFISRSVCLKFDRNYWVPASCYRLSATKLFKCPGGVPVEVPNLLRSLMKALPSRQAYFSK